jgi:hypothetical protein
MRVLLDERSQPPLRAVIGALLGSAREADIAVMHVRIAALDLHADELTHVRKCRILLGKLDAQALMATGPVSANRTDRVAALLLSQSHQHLSLPPHRAYAPARDSPSRNRSLHLQSKARSPRRSCRLSSVRRQAALVSRPAARRCRTQRRSCTRPPRQWAAP